ncbi:hypothetical protein MLD38_037977 [Melastoma candidum]|uniref:Uncharacterized protein n=1 Tax=Melastoma candidum TaxID=119954 RepID=A0ACB9KY64_9MYRT|nr:hypothetical protein MLD38_037977 [Melastoma candidum]
MASFSLEEFVGSGNLKGSLPKLVDEGWDDVPTLKLMTSEDMDAFGMTLQQKEALELRSYLHDRALLQYADRLELSGKALTEILSMTSGDLVSQFGFKRGHMARFLDKTGPCTESLPKSVSSRTRGSLSSPAPGYTKMRQSMTRSSMRSMSISGGKSLEQSLSDLKLKEGHVFKGIVAAGPAEPRACGCVNPPPAVVDQVSPYSTIKDISVQKLAPEHKVGMERLVKTKTPPMKASELWREKPAVLLCIRRPGCIMCRAEAYQLYLRKPIFDALGVQLFAVLHEHIESEVKDFWPRYWGGAVLYDRSMEFFKAMGGGNLLKDKFIPGFLMNPRAIANYKRAKAMGMEMTLRGEGEIKGGLLVVGSGRTGIAYQFIERNFGDWAPVPEVIEMCSKLQNLFCGQQGEE